MFAIITTLALLGSSQLSTSSISLENAVHADVIKQTTCIKSPPEDAWKSCTVLELEQWQAEINQKPQELTSRGKELVKKAPIKWYSLDRYKQYPNAIQNWSSLSEPPVIDAVLIRPKIRSELSDLWNINGTVALSTNLYSQEFVDLAKSYFYAVDNNPTAVEQNAILEDATDRAVKYLIELSSTVWPLIVEARSFDGLKATIANQIALRRSADAVPKPQSSSDCPLYRSGAIYSYVSTGKLVTFSGGKQSLCKNGKWIDKGTVKLEARFLTCSVFNSAQDDGCWVKDSRGFLTWLFDLPQGKPIGKVVSRGSFHTNGGICQVSLYRNFAYRLNCT